MKDKHYIIPFIIFILFAGLGMFQSTGNAAMIKIALEQLAKKADTIVQGTVVNQTSAWNPEHTAIYTDVTVNVEKTISGSPGDSVTFRVKGGVVGEIGMSTSNDPVYENNEKVILFLNTDEVVSKLTGLFQGSCKIVDETVTWNKHKVKVDDFIKAIQAEIGNDTIQTDRYSDQ